MHEYIITELCDPPKQGSSVTIGKIIKGDPDSSGRRVYFDDANGQQWVFWIGDTCETMENFIKRFNQYLVKRGYPKAYKVDVCNTGIEAIIEAIPQTEHFSNWHKVRKGKYFVRISSSDYFNPQVTSRLF